MFLKLFLEIEQNNNIQLTNQSQNEYCHKSKKIITKNDLCKMNVKIVNTNELVL